MTDDMKATLAVLLQHAHTLDSYGEVHRELKTRVLGQVRVANLRDEPGVGETLFDTAFDLGRAYESWRGSLLVVDSEGISTSPPEGTMEANHEFQFDERRPLCCLHCGECKEAHAA